MALYAIGDTHLSLSVDKPMDVFGGGWEGYVDKLREGFSAVAEEDTVVLCGDISWGMSLEEALQTVDMFLDGAVMNRLREVNIIHGKGTGTLRAGIQGYLRKHPRVKSFRAGRYGEGEDGVTVVTLK